MNSSRISYLLAATAITLLIAGCGGSSDNDDEPGTAGTSNTTQVPEKVKIFFTSGEQFKPVEHEITGTGSPPEAATKALVEGPEAIAPVAADKGDAETLIPDGTRVESVEVDDAGEATVDLSEEFLGGIPADAAKRTVAQDEKVTARLGQVTYTLTSFKNVDSVKVRSGGIVVQNSPVGLVRTSNGSGGVSPNTGGSSKPTTEQQRSDFTKPPAVPQAPRTRGGSGGLDQGTRSLQQKLASLGYLPPSGVDGIAGYQTQQAVMAFQSWEGLSRDGVAGPATRGALETAKRPRPRTKRKQGRFMEVHLEKGILLLVRNGRAQRTIHVSAGAPATFTPTGRFRVFRKELMSWSYPFSTWLPFASYFNNGIAFHEYPDVPPYPASHGCVRVPTPDAKRVYGFATMDILVVVRP